MMRMPTKSKINQDQFDGNQNAQEFYDQIKECFLIFLFNGHSEIDNSFLITLILNIHNDWLKIIKYFNKCKFFLLRAL